jgi:hypothetical protein
MVRSGARGPFPHPGIERSSRDRQVDCGFFKAGNAGWKCSMKQWAAAGFFYRPEPLDRASKDGLAVDLGRGRFDQSWACWESSATLGILFTVLVPTEFQIRSLCPTQITYRLKTNSRNTSRFLPSFSMSSERLIVFKDQFMSLRCAFKHAF